jgi:hypothetical protein
MKLRSLVRSKFRSCFKNSGRGEGAKRPGALISRVQTSDVKKVEGLGLSGQAERNGGKEVGLKKARADGRV